ncbi:MAG: methylated-DNA--[protein]-cysteine S-methyltransferase [Spirochaetes bacterium]|nr:methylated-DNA--[protein]-cysteine S-methyltransferase [Spirochaetota bacterium]
MTYYATVSSPVGDLLLVSDGKDLIRVSMEKQKFAAEIGEDWIEKNDVPVLKLAAEQLKSYFAGLLDHFDLPLAFRGTEFQNKVWSELTKIPYGQTISYGELARRVGNPQASRAVGLANGKNPIAIIVPCHRVIGTNGTLTGYGGGLPRKKKLLELEQGLFSP